MKSYREYILALRKCADEHDNDSTLFGYVRVSDLCRATANLLEEFKQEPCEDAVSRKAVQEVVENTIAKYTPMLIGRYEKIPLELAMAIKAIPPITPKCRCSGNPNKSEIPIGSDDCISRADALRVSKNEYLRGWHNALCKAFCETYSIHCEEGNFSVIQEETITGLGLSMDCALGKDVESYMSTIPSVKPIRPKAHWIYDKSIDNWRCSKCGETPKTIGYVGTDTFMAEHFKYCNHCGAEMESEDK